jgi:hypothetical protein
VVAFPELLTLEFRGGTAVLVRRSAVGASAQFVLR